MNYCKKDHLEISRAITQEGGVQGRQISVINPF